jgi:hypothetical protein
MTGARRFQVASRAIRSAVRPLQPETYWQAWLSVLTVPLVISVVGLGLRLAFHTPFDEFPIVGSALYIALVGSRQTLDVRRRRRALHGQPQASRDGTQDQANA